MLAQQPRWSDWIRASASLGLSAILFAIYRAALADALLLQFWPVALAPLYGTRRRLLIELCWLIAVVLIVAAAWPSATLEDWRSVAQIAGAISLVSLAALGMRALSAREHRLRMQAYLDPLTGLLNRRSFLELAGKEEARVRRRDYELGVMMIDIDHFKSVNDTYGHSVGDVVIRRLAEICGRTLRPSDIIARYGGEEFMIGLPETGLEAARLVADRLRYNVAQATILAEGAEVRFTVSIGIAICTRNYPLAAAIRSADEALYVAKHNGRNRVEVAGAPAPAGATPEPAGPAPPRVADIIVPPRPASGGGATRQAAQGTILVVDDEEDIRTLIAEWLAGHGYKVLVADCAGAALELIEANDSIELMCTDIVMPGELNGFDLARRAEEIRPSMKLLYMSAYSVAETVRASQGEATPLVRKPFRLDYLLETIESALQA